MSQKIEQKPRSKHYDWQWLPGYHKPYEHNKSGDLCELPSCKQGRLLSVASKFSDGLSTTGRFTACIRFPWHRIDGFAIRKHIHGLTSDEPNKTLSDLDEQSASAVVRNTSFMTWPETNLFTTSRSLTPWQYNITMQLMQLVTVTVTGQNTSEISVLLCL